MCLIHAIVNNQLVFVRALIAAGANLNTKDMHGRTALMLASQYVAIDVVQALLGAGADKDVKNNNGNTALMLASQYGAITRQNGHTKTVQALLDAGADKDAKDMNGRPALILAIYYNSPALAQALLDAGADKEAKDENGTTALHYAIKYGNTEIVYLLSRRIMAASRIRRFCTDVCYNPTYNFAQRRILREAEYSCEEIDAFMADKDAKSNYDDTALGRIAARCIEVVTALLAAI